MSYVCVYIYIYIHMLIRIYLSMFFGIHMCIICTRIYIYTCVDKFPFIHGM